MKKPIVIGASLFAILVFLGFVFLWYRHFHRALLDTPYQAVLLDNGQSFYGKLQDMDSDFPVLTEVFYVQRQVNSQTKQEKNILIRRGNEWHSPSRTILNVAHIVMIEPVSPGSQVAQLIAASKSKGQ